MKSARSASEQAILEALLHAGSPQRLADLFEHHVAGLSRPGLYHALQQLVSAGLVEKVGTHRNARYAPRERVSFQWTAPLGERWTHLSWAASPPVNWRFPLTTRIASPAARKELLLLLHRIDDRLLHRPDVEVERLHGLADNFPAYKDLGRKQQRTVYLHLTSPASYGPYVVGVFGSAARGDDREGSDVDVIVVLPVLQRPPEGQKMRDAAFQIADFIRESVAEDLRDLAAGHNLDAQRPIDLHVHNDPGRPLPRPLLDAVCREGVTVHTTGPHDLIERPESWLHG